MIESRKMKVRQSSPGQEEVVHLKFMVLDLVNNEYTEK